jgi:hypothetical protein
MVYVKDTKTGDILKLSFGEYNDMCYTIAESGAILALINGRSYEISKK